jgi:hypothetical protein
MIFWPAGRDSAPWNILDQKQRVCVFNAKRSCYIVDGRHPERSVMALKVNFLADERHILIRRCVNLKRALDVANVGPLTLSQIAFDCGEAVCPQRQAIANRGLRFCVHLEVRSSSAFTGLWVKWKIQKRNLVGESNRFYHTPKPPADFLFHGASLITSARKHLRAVVAPVAYVAIAGVFGLQKSIAALRLVAVSRYVSSRSEVLGGALAIWTSMPSMSFSTALSCFVRCFSVCAMVYSCASAQPRCHAEL